MESTLRPYNLSWRKSELADILCRNTYNIPEWALNALILSLTGEGSVTAKELVDAVRSAGAERVSGKSNDETNQSVVQEIARILGYTLEE